MQAIVGHRCGLSFLGVRLQRVMFYPDQVTDRASLAVLCTAKFDTFDRFSPCKRANDIP
jgi:hypothetical protein